MSQYKQIGNAVPVNLAYAMGNKLIALLNNIENRIEVSEAYKSEEKEKTEIQMSLFEPKTEYVIKTHNKKNPADAKRRAADLGVRCSKLPSIILKIIKEISIEN